MSVAAIGALYLGETVEAAMVLLLFLIGERLKRSQPREQEVAFKH
ncbi:copper-translocating P-type ATPase [Vibrio maritimus]|uniref:Copper-translocating P-type ATPase n=1 Tax=Vibrio maritimus TaxID=990268 RepID=A0A090U2W5_9VIBR|nr:copper-translocating P-type ATPase [Vibrio maritimus]